MSEKADGKKISRPKVSFSQSKQNEETVKQCKQKTGTQQPESHDGPKIRSVVSLHIPVKILNPEKKTTSDKVVSCSERKADDSAYAGGTASENTRETVSQAVNDVPETSTEILCYVSDAQHVKEERNMSQLARKTGLDSFVKNYTNLQHKGKENRDRGQLRTAASGVTATIRNQLTKTDTANPKSLIRPLQSNHMPYYNIVAESKLLPVKRSMHRVNDSSVSSTKRQLSHLISPRRQDCSVGKSAVSSASQHTLGQIFEHPRCNSIMCVTDNLKRLERQKIVTDINHLPPLQKSLINGKISTALDFKLDEAIYKNLVDLTIDEDMLPIAITRSRDPQPRQKDITPKLCDFFVPEDTREHCEAARVKPRPPRIDENWNAFRISAKIFEWRHNLDDSSGTA